MASRIRSLLWPAGVVAVVLGFAVLCARLIAYNSESMVLEAADGVNSAPNVSAEAAAVDKLVAALGQGGYTWGLEAWVEGGDRTGSATFDFANVPIVVEITFSGRGWQAYSCFGRPSGGTVTLHLKSPANLTPLLYE